MIDQQALQTYLQSLYPEKRGIAVRDLTNISTGWESDIYRFTLEYDGAQHCSGQQSQQEQRVLRLYPGDDARGKSTAEFNSMQALQRAGYPVPRVDHLEIDNSPFGQPFMLMEYIQGEMMWDRMCNGSHEEREVMLRLFCRLFVQLHQLDWRQYTADPSKDDHGDPYVFIDRQLADFQWAARELPIEGFLPLLRWLEEHGVPPDPELVGRVLAHAKQQDHTLTDAEIKALLGSP